MSDEDRTVNQNNELVIYDTTEQKPYEANLKPRVKSALCKKESLKKETQSEL
jgi:hypothetical protein